MPHRVPAAKKNHCPFLAHDYGCKPLARRPRCPSFGQVLVIEVIGVFKPTIDVDLKEDETLTPTEKLKDATPKVGVEVTF
jgi:hypothetical protein